MRIERLDGSWDFRETKTEENFLWKLLNSRRITSSLEQMPHCRHVSLEAVEPIFFRFSPEDTCHIGDQTPHPVLNDKMAQRKNTRLSPQVDRIDDLRITHLPAGDTATSPAQVDTLRREIDNGWLAALRATIREVAVLEPCVQRQSLVEAGCFRYRGTHDHVAAISVIQRFCLHAIRAVHARFSTGTKHPCSMPGDLLARPPSASMRPEAMMRAGSATNS